MNAQTLAESVGALRQSVLFIEAKLGESRESPNRQEWLDALTKKRLLLHNLEEYAAFLSPASDSVDAFHAGGCRHRVTQT